MLSFTANYLSWPLSPLLERGTRFPLCYHEYKQQLCFCYLPFQPSSKVCHHVSPHLAQEERLPSFISCLCSGLWIIFPFSLTPDAHLLTFFFFFKLPSELLLLYPSPPNFRFSPSNTLPLPPSYQDHPWSCSLVDEYLHGVAGCPIHPFSPGLYWPTSLLLVLCYFPWPSLFAIPLPFNILDYFCDLKIHLHL